VYDSTRDPYCYVGTTVLKNRANLRDQEALDAFEHDAALQRAEESYPAGRLSVSHYKAIHRHLFQDVYSWAGQFRTVRIAKGGSMFCYPEHIASEMKRLFGQMQSKRYFRGLDADAFAGRVAHFLAELNAIHPFREGNGRTQLSFLTLLADNAGHPLDLERLDPDAILQAVINSFQGDEARLRAVVRDILTKALP
jgi:cell filamentation protein